MDGQKEDFPGAAQQTHAVVSLSQHPERAKCFRAGNDFDIYVASADSDDPSKVWKATLNEWRVSRTVLMNAAKRALPPGEESSFPPLPAKWPGCRLYHGDTGEELFGGDSRGYQWGARNLTGVTILFSSDAGWPGAETLQEKWNKQKKELDRKDDEDREKMLVALLPAQLPAGLQVLEINLHVSCHWAIPGVQLGVFVSALPGSLRSFSGNRLRTDKASLALLCSRCPQLLSLSLS